MKNRGKFVMSIWSCAAGQCRDIFAASSRCHNAVVARVAAPGRP